MNHLGVQLLRARTRRHMTLDDTARSSGLNRVHIWGLEKGRVTNPTIATVVRLAAALEVSPIRLAKAAINDLELIAVAQKRARIAK